MKKIRKKSFLLGFQSDNNSEGSTNTTITPIRVMKDKHANNKNKWVKDVKTFVWQLCLVQKP